MWNIQHHTVLSVVTHNAVLSTCTSISRCDEWTGRNINHNRSTKMWPSGAMGVFSVYDVWNMYSCGSVVEHWVSSAKSCGFNSQGKMYSLSKSQASAQCVNVNSQSKCRRRDLLFRRWAARDLRVRAEVRYKQLNMMRQFSNICQTFTNKIKSYTSDINFQERKAASGLFKFLRF